MKRIINAFTLLVLLTAAGCKKSNEDKDSGGSDEPVQEWATYNTSNSGLVDNQVNVIAIDRLDTKWIGTPKGLVRLQDGKWTIFDTANTPLPSPYITSIAVENNGTLWVGTAKGLARFSQFGWTVFSKSNSVLPDNEITSLTHDARHRITWIGTSKGLVKIDANNNWKLYSELEDQVILSMTTDLQGTLWMGVFQPIAFKGRIIKLENEKFTSYRLDELGYASAFPYALSVNDKQEVLATLSGTEVKNVIRLRNNNWEEVTRPESARGPRAIITEGDKVWVGGNALFAYGDKSAKLIAIPGTDSPILSMAIDSKGGKWLGTFYGGIAVYHDVQ